MAKIGDLEEKIPLDVGLYVDTAQAQQIYSRSGLCLIGMAHTWQVNTGGALNLGAERTFQRIFANVERLKSTEEFANKPLTLLITPQLKNFNISQSLAADLILYCKLVDKTGQTIYENTIPAQGSGQGAMGCLLGVFAGKKALSDTSADAFNTAFAMLASDIVRKVDFSPYLKKPAF